MGERCLTRYVIVLMREIASGSLDINSLLSKGLAELLECKEESESSGEEFFHNPEFKCYDQRFCDLLLKIQRKYPDFDTSPYETIYDRTFGKSGDDLPGRSTGGAIYVGDDPEAEKRIRDELGKTVRRRRDSERLPTRVIT